MRCLVTGAAGFVGSSLVEALLADGHDVVGVDCFVNYYPRASKERNISVALKSPKYRFVEANLLDFDLGSELKNCEWVFHQAAQAGVRASWGSYFSSYTDNNITATQRLLEEARNHSSIKKIVYASSSSVYGNAERFPTGEDLRPAPLSPYGVTKLAAEHLMSLYAHEYGVPTVSLRYFTVYGPRQRPDMAFHRAIKCGLNGETFTAFGDGEQSRDFTFIADIVRANIISAERGAPGSVFNVGGGTQATLNQVLEIIREGTGKLDVRYQERQLGDARHTSADTARIKRDLGFIPHVQLRDGIAEQIAWARKSL